MKRICWLLLFFLLLKQSAFTQCIIPVIASVNPQVVCQGQQVYLSAQVIPNSCGASPSCSGNNVSGTVGSGNINQPGTISQPPTLLGNFNNSGRNEMLYLASELTPALGGPCVIKSISFNLSIFNSASWLQNFTVKIGCTNATSLSNWDNTLNTFFFSAAGIQPAAGWSNTITLNTAFAWDGVSNVVVDICWNSFSFGSQNNKAECSNTAFNSYLTLSSNSNLCGTNNAPTVSMLRPNIRFNYCFANINDYNVLWTPNSGINSVVRADTAITTANPNVSTSYIINVSDGAGCTGADTVSVQVDNSRVNAGADVNACPGNVVSLVATPIGTLIPGPPAYTWTTLAGTNVGNTQNISVSPAVTTTYVVAMSGGGCIKRDTVTVNIGGLTVLAAPTNITCNGYNNGKIKITSNGLSPLSYTWSLNANTGNVDSAINLSPAVYNVTVSDPNGCSGTASAQITQPTAVAFTSNVTNNICFGGNIGAITVNPSGGTGTYSYLWSNSLPSNQTVSALTAGNYSVTVSDSSLCSATATINVSEPAQIVFGNATVQGARCFGGNSGRISVSVSGGTGVYTYRWSHNMGLNSPVASNLSAATYTVSVTDANSCSASATYSVSQPTALNLPVPTVTNVTCFGGNNASATANPTGGVTPYTYSWNPTAQVTQTATGLSAQSYNVTVTDDSLCTASASVTISQPAQISIAGTVTNVQCNGNNDGAIDITIANGVAPLTYLWSNAATTQDLSNLFIGNYSVTVTDNSSCTQTATYNLTEPSSLVISSPASITPVSCFGGNDGSITVTVAGGTPNYTYIWNVAGNSSTLSSLTSGIYTVTATDTHGCSASASNVVTEPFTPVTLGNAAITNVLCNGLSTGAITVSVSGGTGAYTYRWSQNGGLNNATASSLAANNYLVTVTDANSCTASASYFVTEPAAITFSAPTVNNVSCFGYTDGSIEVFVSGGVGSYTYSWNGTAGNNPMNNLTAGNYTVVVADANNCTASTNVTITQPSTFSITLTAHDATCNGAPNGFIDANPSGGTPGYNYLWSNNAVGQSDFALSAGAYSVTVTDNNSCSVSASATIHEPAPLSFNLTATQVKCPGDKNGTITISNAQGGTAPYNFSATQDGSNFFYASGDIIVGLASGYYAVIFADDNGCTLVDTAFVPSPVADAFTYTADSTSCYGTQYNDGSVHVTALTLQNTPYQYGADGGALSFLDVLYNLTAGTHTITAQNNWGCTSNFTVLVPEPQNGIVDVYPTDTTVELGHVVQLSSSFSPYPASAISSYQWSPAAGLSCIDCWNPVLTTYNRSNQYTLTVNYNGNCVATASLTVEVKDTLKFFIPNSFSPNGDGNNDQFMIYGEGIKQVDLKIFNRWGEMVYQSSNQFSGWDGTYKGVLQNPAVFTYSAKITFLDNRQAERMGSVMLLR